MIQGDTMLRNGVGDGLPKIADNHDNPQQFKLFNMDAEAWLREIDDESVDLIITDPPYESLEKHRKIGTTTRLKNSKASSNEWFTIFPNARFRELLHEVYRVLKKQPFLPFL